MSRSEFRVADLGLAAEGHRTIAWAEDHMPVLIGLRQALAAERPLAGQRLAGCVHVTKETAVLVRTLIAAGAEVSWTGGNQITTQDAVAAALAEDGVRIFAWRGMTKDEVQDGIDAALTVHSPAPTLLVDDGADMIAAVHARFPAIAAAVLGGTDKTTSGVQRLRRMAEAGRLRFPIVGVNDVVTKWVYDNTYGTGQSVIDGILRASGILFAGKLFVVGGFGHVSRGVAHRARGLGARVVVTCVHATTALRAVLEGFDVMPMDQAAPIGDIFCTATGMSDILVGRHFAVMKDAAIVCNAGHSDSELRLSDLRAQAHHIEAVRPNVEAFRMSDGRSLFLLSEGGLVNLAAAEGNPSEVMDLSFANQVLGLRWLLEHRDSLDNRVHDLPDEQDQNVARMKLDAMGVRLDRWTADQLAYATDHRNGT